MNYKEINFEESIQKYLVTKGGYHISDGLGYDRLKGYNPKVLIDYIASTQNKKWMKLTSIHGEYTKDYFLKKVEEQIKEHGLLATLRDKIKLDGMDFKLVYFKPETSMNLELKELYDGNTLECVRQLHYSPKNENSIDITLFVNPDGRSLSANVYDASGKAGTFFKSYTENPLISLFKSPVGFINKLSNVADKQADKIRKTDLNYDDVFQKM